MTLDAGAIEEAITGGDAARVRDLLRDATAKERAACATALGRLFAEPGARLDSELVPSTFIREPRQAAAYVAARAVAGTGSAAAGRPPVELPASVAALAAGRATTKLAEAARRLAALASA